MQAVLSSRQWPNTVDEYASMMDESAARPVRFTNKGDDAVVLYNFFKMTLGLRIKRDADALNAAVQKLLSLRETLSSHASSESAVEVTVESAVDIDASMASYEASMANVVDTKT